MSSSSSYVTIRVSPHIMEQLPPEPDIREHVLELGVRQWRILEALEDYRRGHGTLAYAAEQAGVSLREIIPLAYAHGLTPAVEPDLLSQPLTLDRAATL